MDAYTITYVTYGSENPIFTIVAPNNGMQMPMPMHGMPMPMSPMGLQVPFGQFAQGMTPMGPMVPICPMPPGIDGTPGQMPNVMSCPIYSDPSCMPMPDMFGGASWMTSPNYLTESKVEIVEEEPEPEDGGQEASLNLGVTAQTLDKTSEMMRSLAEKLETDKECLWSRHNQQGPWKDSEDQTSAWKCNKQPWSEKDGTEWKESEDQTSAWKCKKLSNMEPVKATIEDNTPRQAEKSNLKGLEILSLLRPKKVVRKAGSDAGESCGRVTTASVTSSPCRRKRNAQKRFCCNFILKFSSHYVPMIIGKGGQNTKDIYNQTGCKIRVRGKGSGHMEQGTNQEAPTPLMLAVTAEPNNKAGFLKALELSMKLLESVEERWCNENMMEWCTGFKISMEDEDMQGELDVLLGDTFVQRGWNRSKAKGKCDDWW